MSIEMKKIMSQCWRIFKKISLFGGAIMLVLVLAGSALLLAYFSKEALSFPRARIGDISFGARSYEEVKQKLAAADAVFHSQKIEIRFKGYTEMVTPKDLGLSFDHEATLKTVPFFGNQHNLRVFLSAVQDTPVAPVLNIEDAVFETKLASLFPAVPRARNASFMRAPGGGVDIISEQGGWRMENDVFAERLLNEFQDFSPRPIEMPFVHEKPQVLRADLEQNRDALLAQLASPLYLRSEKSTWEIIPLDHLPFVRFHKENDAVFWTLDHFPLEALIAEQIAPALEQQEQGVKIYRGENDRVIFEGDGEFGYRIDKKQLYAAIDFAFAQKLDSVSIPLKKISPPLDISSDLLALGVRELISVGYSTFYNSPVNRVHNIGVGISRYNGLIVPPGEVFSFNDNLGVVDGGTGYRQELVIKEEGTIPEFGGGLCQVSTTIFRAAINAGLPIVERSPHSYAVTYYSQVGGHGLDATIYPPDKDIKFKNDTPGHIVIQAYRDGYEAYYKLYGTADGRRVELDGPYFANRTSAPAEAIEYIVDNLQPGERKQVQKPVNGFDATWYRTVIMPNGEERKETIFSHYRAMPAKYRVGREPMPVEGMPEDLAEANPS